MPLIQDIAVVSGGRDASARHALSVTDPQQDLPAAAWMVHQYMLGEAQRSGGQPVAGAEPGVEWVTWQGTLSHALAELQIGDPRKEDEFAKVRKAVSYRLRDHGNAVCLVRGGRLGRGDVTQWAIRTVFREAEASQELPVFSMTAAHLQVMPKRRATPTPSPTTSPTSSTPPAPSTASAHATAAIARTVAPRGLARADSIPCPSCGTVYHKTYLGRHFYSTHADASEIVLGAIKQRGTAYRTELASLLSEAAAGAIISPSYIATVLAPSLDAVPPLIKFHRGFGGNCYYIWTGADDAHLAAKSAEAARVARSLGTGNAGKTWHKPEPVTAPDPARGNGMDPHGVLDGAVGAVAAASGGNEVLRQAMYDVAHRMSSLSTQLNTVAGQLASAANSLSLSDDEREELIQLRLLRDRFRELAGGK